MLVYQRVCSIRILICIFFIRGPFSNHDSFHANGHSVPFNTYGRPCRQGNFHHLPSTQNCCDANTPRKKGAFLKHQPSGGLTCSYTCVSFSPPPPFLFPVKKNPELFCKKKVTSLTRNPISHSSQKMESVSTTWDTMQR